MNELEQMAQNLDADPDYRVLRRLNVPDAYSTPDGVKIHLGLFADTETTGLEVETVGIIEIALLPFEFSSDGRIFRVRKDDALSELNDPGIPIPSEVTDITGITDEMVAGKRINSDQVQDMANQASLIVAHNARFDRPIMERHWPVFRQQPWACTWHDLPWRSEGISTGKLDYLGYQFGFFFESHRAINDCLAGLEILSRRFPKSGDRVLGTLLETARAPSFQIWAVNTSFAKKPDLKDRGYNWNPGTDGRPKAWWTEVAETEKEAELTWLAENIYGKPTDVLIYRVTARERHSNRPVGATAPTA